MGHIIRSWKYCCLSNSEANPCRTTPHPSGSSRWLANKFHGAWGLW